MGGGKAESGREKVKVGEPDSIVIKPHSTHLKKETISCVKMLGSV